MPTPYARPSWWSFSHEIRRRVHRARVPRPDLRGARRRCPSPGASASRVELHETPGGAAITAIGLARLGLRVAVAAPLGSDVAGTTGLASARGRGRQVRRHDARPHAGHGRAPARRRAGVRDVRAARARRARARRGASTRAPSSWARAAASGLRTTPSRTSSSATAKPSATQARSRANVGRARALLANRFEAERLTGEGDRGSRGARARRAGGRWRSSAAAPSARSPPPTERCSTVPLLRWRCGTRRAPATCSPPPTCGGIWKDCRSSSGCGGRSCTPPSPCRRPPGSPARLH